MESPQGHEISNPRIRRWWSNQRGCCLREYGSWHWSWWTWLPKLHSKPLKEEGETQGDRACPQLPKSAAAILMMKAFTLDGRRSLIPGYFLNHFARRICEHTAHTSSTLFYTMVQHFLSFCELQETADWSAYPVPEWHGSRFSGWFFWGHANLISRSYLRPMWSTPKSCWICGRIALTTTGLTREQLDQPGSATSSDVHQVCCVCRWLQSWITIKTSYVNMSP